MRTAAAQLLLHAQQVADELPFAPPIPPGTVRSPSRLSPSMRTTSGAISRQEYDNDRSMAAALEARRRAALAKLAQARAMEVSAQRKLSCGSMK